MATRTHSMDPIIKNLVAAPFVGEEVIPMEMVRAFAQLSGDWNPIHINPKAPARYKLPWKCQGVHAFLVASRVAGFIWGNMNKRFGTRVAPITYEIKYESDTSLRFHNPVFPGTPVRYQVSFHFAGQRGNKFFLDLPIQVTQVVGVNSVPLVCYATRAKMVLCKSSNGKK